MDNEMYQSMKANILRGIDDVNAEIEKERKRHASKMNALIETRTVMQEQYNQLRKMATG